MHKGTDRYMRGVYAHHKDIALTRLDQGLKRQGFDTTTRLSRMYESIRVWDELDRRFSK